MGPLVFARPFDACGDSSDTLLSMPPEEVDGKVLVMRRGGCTFANKAGAVASLLSRRPGQRSGSGGGPVAVVVVDNPVKVGGPKPIGS